MSSLGNSLPAEFALAARNLTTWSAALPLLAELNRTGIPCLVLKSLPQIEDLYGNAAGRVTSDVDLLVRGQDAGAVMRIAGDLGWRPKFPERYAAYVHHHGPGTAAALGPWPLQHPETGDFCEIDLHTDVMPAWLHPTIDAAIWQTASTVRQDGIEFLLPSPEDRLVFLCWHAVVERLPQRKLPDIAYILRDGHKLDWDYIARRVRSSGTTAFFWLACEHVLATENVPVAPLWRRYLPLTPRVRAILRLRRLSWSDHDTARRIVLLLRLFAYDRLDIMLPLWRLALLPARLEVATRIGHWPSWRSYPIELFRIYRRRLSTHGWDLD